MTQQDRYGTVLKWWRRTLITLTALSAAAASFVFLRDLALHVGWPPWAAVLLPLSVDALAAAALTEYRLTRTKAPLLVAVLAIVGSATGNAYSHLYTVGLMEPGWVAVTSVGAVPAVTVGLVVHLFTARGSTWNRSNSPTSTSETGSRSSQHASGSDMTSARRRAVSPPQPTTDAPAAEPSPNGHTTPAVPNSKPRTKPTSSRKRSDTELISTVLQQSWTDKPLDELTSLLSVSKSRATRIRSAAREQTQHSRPHLNGQPSNPDQIGAMA